MNNKNLPPGEPPESREGERSEPDRDAGGSPGARERVASTGPDPEVTPRARRRRFTAAYKLKIVAAADRCTKPGEVGALLRREGLYTSHLADWRRARDQGQLAALAPKRRGPKANPDLALEKRCAKLERENEHLKKRLETAETILEVQGNVSRLLGLTMPKNENDS